jgi:hypothetical protein
MKLYFSDPTSRPAININRLSRITYNMKEIILSTPSEIDTLIVLGDGSPEDEIVGILTWHQRANPKTAGVVKPEKHHTDSFCTIRAYLESLKARCFLFIIDQDNVPLDDLFERIEIVFHEQGITLTSSHRIAADARLKVYECAFASRQFRVIAVISGLADFEAPAHEIEDHLLKLAGIDAAQDAKKSWNQLGKERREAILRSLKDEKVLQAAFPQHFIAFSML